MHQKKLTGNQIDLIYSFSIHYTLRPNIVKNIILSTPLSMDFWKMKQHI